MSIQLTGRSGNRADVSPRGELLVAGAVESALTNSALTTGEAYVWHSQDLNVAAAGTLIAVRNDSGSQDLVITRIIIVGGDVTSRYEIHKVDVAYTSTGTPVVAINLGNSGTLPDATAHADESANSQVAANVFMEVVAIALTTVEVEVGIVLGRDQAIVIDQVSESGAGAATVFGYFVDRN